MVYQKQLVSVKNLNGTQDNEPPLGYDKQCSNCGTDENLVGAHVKKVNSNDNKHYIVPLCKKCNNLRNKTFIIYSELVPVNPK